MKWMKLLIIIVTGVDIKLKIIKMCDKKQFKYCPSEIDDCMRHCIKTLNQLLDNIEHKPYKILACCCGHNKYPMTIVMENPRGIFELFSNKDIPRKKKFYKKDKEGYYYIPETIKNKNQKI